MTVYDSDNEVSILFKRLPGNVRAFSLVDKECRIVVLNDCLSEKAKKKSYLHELKHFERGDHRNDDYIEYA